MSLKSNELYRRCLSDIKVELDEEFDKNFTRQSFMGEDDWPKRNPDLDAGRSVLTQSGALRRSVRSAMGGKAIRYHSPKPYARIHNEGGDITVTDRKSVV